MLFGVPNDKDELGRNRGQLAERHRDQTSRLCPSKKGFREGHNPFRPSPSRRRVEHQECWSFTHECNQGAQTCANRAPRLPPSGYGSQSLHSRRTTPQYKVVSPPHTRPAATSRVACEEAGKGQKKKKRTSRSAASLPKPRPGQCARSRSPHRSAL
jgi:hypothetical protein